MNEENLVRKHFVEIIKLSFETMKHLTTLSSGALILLTTFLDRLFGKSQEWKWLVGITLVLFVVSTVTAMFSLVQLSGILTYTLSFDEKAERRERIRTGINVVALLSFLFGLITLCIFALKNLY